MKEEEEDAMCFTSQRGGRRRLMEPRRQSRFAGSGREREDAVMQGGGQGGRVGGGVV